MENRVPKQPSGQTIRDLYPTLTEAELRQAQANLRRYLEITLEVQREQMSRGFDTSQNLNTMRERSNDNLKS